MKKMADELNPKYGPVSIAAQMNHARELIELYVFADIESVRYCATEVTFEKLEDGSRHPHETLAINEATAKQLMDSLWQAGVRPSDQFGRREGLTAKQAHIDDLRTVLFHTIGVEGGSDG